MLPGKVTWHKADSLETSRDDLFGGRQQSLEGLAGTRCTPLFLHLFYLQDSFRGSFGLIPLIREGPRCGAGRMQAGRMLLPEGLGESLSAFLLPKANKGFARSLLP